MEVKGRGWDVQYVGNGLLWLWEGSLHGAGQATSLRSGKCFSNSFAGGFASRRDFKWLYLKSGLPPCRSPEAELTADGGLPSQSGQEPGGGGGQGPAAGPLDGALPGLPASQGQASGGLHGGDSSGGDKAGTGQQPRHQQQDTLPGRGVGKHASVTAPLLCCPGAERAERGAVWLSCVSP